MKAFFALVVLGLVIQTTVARDIRLSKDCLNGVADRYKCCKGVPDAWLAHLRNPENINSFYQCTNGIPVLMPCPAGLGWSVEGDICDWITAAPTPEDSDESSEESKNLPEGCYDGTINVKTCCDGITAFWVHLPDPKDCSKFYHCDNGKAVHKDCPGGLHWSIAADRCEWPENAHCQGNPIAPTIPPVENTDAPVDESTNTPIEETTVLEPVEVTTVPQPTDSPVQDTTVDIVVPTNPPAESTDAPIIEPTNLPEEESTTEAPVQTDAPVQETTTEEVVDTTNAPSTKAPIISSTNPPAEVSTEGEVITDAPVVETTERAVQSTEKPTLPSGCYDGSIDVEKCCEGISAWWVHLPDPKDCGKFYHCDNGVAVHKDCPAGLHWSVAADRCEWPYKAGCAAQPTTPTEETTSVPTTSTIRATTEEAVQTTDSPVQETTVSEEIPTNPPVQETTEGPVVEPTNYPIEATTTEEVVDPTNAPSTEAPIISPTNPPAEVSTEGEVITDAPVVETTERAVQSTEKPTLPSGCYDGSIDVEKCCEGISAWWVHLPDPKDCGKFYHCDNGVAVHKDCPAGLHWSVAADRCEWPYKAGCAAQPTTPTEEATDGPVVKPTNSPTEATTTEEVVDPTNAPSTEAPITLPTNPPAEVSTEGEVITDVPVVETTEGVVQSTEKPTLPNGCYDGSIDVEICCQGITAWWVHLPDLENCEKFYHCDNGVAVHKDCPAGLHWSISADRCEWPSTAGCESRSTQSVTDTTQHEDISTTSLTEPIPTVTEIVPSSTVTTTENASTQTEPWITQTVTDPSKNSTNPGNNSTASVTEPTQNVTEPSFTSTESASNQTETWTSTPGHNSTVPSDTTVPSNTTEQATTLSQNQTTTELPWTSTPSNSNTTKPNQENGKCEPIPICHQCLTGVFPADQCCNDVPNWQKIKLANTNECTSYYECIDEAAVLRKCPDGLYWSSKAERCEWPKNSECIPSTTAPSVETTVDNNDGAVSIPGISEECLRGNIDAATCCRHIPYWLDVLLQNNKDCHTYYQCVHGVPYVRPCPSHLWWSVTANRCEWLENATCTWETYN